jgi:predicted nucleic acid-binding protein
VPELARLIQEGLVEMIGPVRQEILSGLSQPKQFEQIKSELSAFPDFQLRTGHFESGAEFFNTCRKKGIQGSHTDFLICAVAALESMAVFTTDHDFTRFSKVLPVTLHHPRPSA